MTIRNCHLTVRLNEAYINRSIRQFPKSHDPLGGHGLKQNWTRFRSRTLRTGQVTCTLRSLYIVIDYHASHSPWESPSGNQWERQSRKEWHWRKHWNEWAQITRNTPINQRWIWSYHTQWRQQKQWRNSNQNYYGHLQRDKTCGD